MRHDQGAVSDEELLLRLLGLETSGREVIVSFIDAPERDWLEVYGQAVWMARNPSAQVLQTLHNRGAYEKHLRSLVWLRRALNGIYVELHRRIDHQEVGRALYRTIVDREGSLHELLAALHVERITSYRRNREDDEDLRSDALRAALQKLEKFRSSPMHQINLPSRVNLSALPVDGLPPTEGRWDWPAIRARQVAETLRLLLPLLNGDAEKLPETVRQAMREHFRKWNAAKRTGLEISLAEENESGTPLAELAAESDTERTALSKHEVLSFLKIAEERWGPMGTASLRALYEGNTTQAAAKLAGISRQTGHNYIRELRRHTNRAD